MNNHGQIVSSNPFLKCREIMTSLRWNQHSKDVLNHAEASILSNIKVPFDLKHISIGNCVGINDKIWTLLANVQCKNTPIVLLHGFGAALGFWIKNIDALAENHPVFAIDLLGFGKSSRPNFANDPNEVEFQFCESIERWRKAMSIENMILLGHSFGGFLAASYSMKYHDHVEHLILADPWGFTKKPDLSKRPYWQRMLYLFFGIVTPLTMLRTAGPMGEWFIRMARPDVMPQYGEVLSDQRIMITYIHQCNTDYPSGEFAFQKLLFCGPWAKNPIGERFKDNLPSDLPVTFLYGANSWMSKWYGNVIKESRINSYTHIEIISESGHNVFSDNANEFNEFTLNACSVLKSNCK